MHFLEWKCLNFDLDFTEIFSKVRINNISALVQIMAWYLVGAKPLSEAMLVSLLTHICVTRPQWINVFKKKFRFSHHLTRRSEDDNTPQPLDQWMNSPFIGQQVGNCKSFTLTHYLADLFAMHRGPRSIPGPPGKPFKPFLTFFFRQKPFFSISVKNLF